MSEMTKKTDQITWINGLKGIACMVVFLHHFVLSFYQSVYFGEEAQSLTKSHIDVLLSYKPYGVILNGNFAVCIFIMISAFLFAGKTIKMTRKNQKQDYLELFIRRYLRLLPSVALVGGGFHIILNILERIGKNWTTTKNILPLKELLKHLLYLQWVNTDTSVLGPLWCINILFVGSFIAIFFAEFSREYRWYLPFVYLILAGAFKFTNPYYMAVLFGVLLADVYHFERVKQWSEWLNRRWKVSFLFHKGFRYVAGAVIVLAGIFLGGYPSYVQPDNRIYSMFVNVQDAYIFVHCIGAFLLMAGLMILPQTKILSCRIAVFFGDISFGIYLIHSIVISSMSYQLEHFLADRIESYSIRVFCSFCASFIVLVGLSYLFHRFFEVKVSRLVGKIHFSKNRERNKA